MNIEPMKKNISIWSSYMKERVFIENCPICDHNDFLNINKVMPINDCKPVQCKNCGFVTYNPQPKNLSSFYKNNKIAQSAAFLKTKNNKIIKHNNLLFKFLKDSDKKYNSFFDYGCSDGYLMKMFQEYNPEAKTFGIELNEGHLNWAKYIEDLNVSGDEDLSKVKETFDIISLFHVLEHIQNPDKLIVQLRQMLNDDGLLYVSAPTMNKIDYSNLNRDKGDHCFFKDEHINIFTDELLRKFIESHGFEIAFSDFNIYGTTYIFKKTKNYPSVSFNKEDFLNNTNIFDELMNAYLAKEKFEKNVITNKVLALNTVKEDLKKLKKVVFPELVLKAASLMDHLDREDLFDDYIKKYPHIINFKIEKALSYFKHNYFELAEKCFLELINDYGYNETVYAHMAYTKYHQNDYLECIKYLKKLIKKDPFDPGKINVTGSILVNM